MLRAVDLSGGTVSVGFERNASKLDNSSRNTLSNKIPVKFCYLQNILLPLREIGGSLN